MGSSNSASYTPTGRNSFRETTMPEKETVERARGDAREGKAPSTQAGEIVREEIHHVREGKQGVCNPKQAIAIGLSKARKARVKLPPAPKGTASAEKEFNRRSRRSRTSRRRPSKTRSRATTRALKREGRSGASHKALSSQARSSARRRSQSSRSQAARKAARTRTSSRSHRARG
jgi:hypothetical protein